MDKLSISVIIPTHNRKDSLEELLIALGSQKYPMDLIEVVVVADGCVDSTLKMLKSFDAPYRLKFIEQPGSGPATARNKGASMAENQLLLFLDDDIIPSEGLLAAHANTHLNYNTVVVGYLPILVTKTPDLLALETRSWWEELYYKMQHPGYRYTFKDLLSGNFSLHATLFNSLQGFNDTLRCREDYELGARLIKHGAHFIFSREAWGYHNDTLNSLKRFIGRKRSEGHADVQFARIHPDMTRQMPLFSLSRVSPARKSALIFLLFKAKVIIRIYFSLLEKLLNISESLKLRGSFRRIVYQLNKYWYFVGVADEVKTPKNFDKLLRSVALPPEAMEDILEIDLKNGISAAERQIDENKPSVVHLFYGRLLVAKIPHRPEAEQLRGRHLRPILVSDHYMNFLKIMALDTLLEAPQITAGDNKVSIGTGSVFQQAKTASRPSC